MEYNLLPLDEETAAIIGRARLSVMEELVWRMDAAGLEPCCIATVLGLSESTVGAKHNSAAKKMGAIPDFPTPPSLSSYVRVEDTIQVVDDGFAQTVYGITEWCVYVNEQKTEYLSLPTIDRLYRLLLCPETVAVGDVLWWNGEFTVSEVTPVGCLLVGGDTLHGWSWINANFTMLRRTPASDGKEQ